MATDKAAIIESICNAIARDDAVGVAAALKAYPCPKPVNAGRSYSVVEATRVFVRDGFIDRYSGLRLVNPAVLRVLSNRLPREFPFQKNWKMSETHPAYWELVPTIDHLRPVARGGEDVEANWITTSMLRNAAKANWTVEELGWTVLPSGDFSQWDGLTGWLTRYVDEHGTQGQEPYVLEWYKAACKVVAEWSATREPSRPRLPG